MLIDTHVAKLNEDTFELRVDRFTYHLTLKQVLDLYNSLKQLFTVDTRGETQMIPDSESKQAGIKYTT